MAAGKYKGFDDPQLATIMAFRRRGIQAAAIREYILALGISESETTFDMNILESINRKIVDTEARRYFFIDNPQKLEFGAPIEREAKIRKHPQHPEMGERVLKFSREIYLSKSDMTGDDFMLMGAMLPARIEGKKIKPLEAASNRRFIHWLPADEAQTISAEVWMPDGNAKIGVLEKNILSEKPGAVVQLERFGFARIDAVWKDKANIHVSLYYTHK